MTMRVWQNEVVFSLIADGAHIVCRSARRVHVDVGLSRHVRVQLRCLYLFSTLAARHACYRTIMMMMMMMMDVTFTPSPSGSSGSVSSQDFPSCVVRTRINSLDTSLAGVSLEIMILIISAALNPSMTMMMMMTITWAEWDADDDENDKQRQLEW